MYKEEYEILTEKVSERTIIISDLVNDLDRTLLYGYTCDRDTWHVYIKQNCIYTVIYEYEKEPVQVEVNKDEDYIPNKRLYPECCDYEFCKLLKEKGVYLPFTTWQDRDEKKIYYGKVLTKCSLIKTEKG
jgi:hypothetical protein